MAPRLRSQPSFAALLVASAAGIGSARSSEIRPPRSLRSASSRASVTATSASAASAAARSTSSRSIGSSGSSPSPASRTTTPTVSPPAITGSSPAIGWGGEASASATRAFAYSARPFSSSPAGERALRPRAGSTIATGPWASAAASSATPARPSPSRTASSILVLSSRNPGSSRMSAWKRLVAMREGRGRHCRPRPRDRGCCLRGLRPTPRPRRPRGTAALARPPRRCGCESPPPPG